MSLHFSDFRACERTFQLITQVSGRAGRENKTGKVILQTYTPHHYVYKYAVGYDYKAFFEKEENLREIAKYPPFSKIVRILVSGENEDDAGRVLKGILGETETLCKEHGGSFAYLAAMRSPVKKIKDLYRMQILMRVTDDFDFIIRKIYDIIDRNGNRNVTVFAEINPSNLN
jgi:primosomal protein N' (replication factor Y)